jgi:hypothetical protein
MKLYEKIKYSFPHFTEVFGKYVDKLQAKEIVMERAGDLVCIPKTVRIMKSHTDLSSSDINPDWMIKTTHGSSQNIIFHPGVDYNINWILSMLERYTKSFYLTHGESQYKWVEPRFFIEEKIEDYFNGKDGNAITFMIYCLNGKPSTVIFMDKKQDRYRHFLFLEDGSLEQIPIQNQIFYAFEIPSKAIMERMYRAASRLSEPFEFVRVDFYLGKGGELYFSEFTFTPNSGEQIYSDALESRLGALWV